jgi:AcrR family transcriptional regulator
VICYTVPIGTKASEPPPMKGKQIVKRVRRLKPRPNDPALRERLLRAAFTEFRERGFSAASTLEIATQAQVSKRELYAQFDSKQAMLAACIVERAGRMRQPLNLVPEIPESREALEATLVQFGQSILEGLSDPNVLTVYRLAIAESALAPDIGHTLDKAGREANHRALSAWLAKAQVHGLVGAGDPTAMAAQFLAILGGGLLIQLLLRVREAPTARDIERRARVASQALMLLYPQPPRPGD